MKPLKRIDFAAPQPSLSKLPDLPDGSADPDDVDDDDDESLDDSSSSSSGDGQGNNGRRPRSSEGNISGSSNAGNNMNNGSSSNDLGGGGSGGLMKLVAHASSGGGNGGAPSKNGPASSSTGAAFGRWLSRRNNPAPGTGPSGYPVDDESDPDKHYFARGLGELDDASSPDLSADDEDDDKYETVARGQPVRKHAKGLAGTGAGAGAGSLVSNGAGVAVDGFAKSLQDEVGSPTGQEGGNHGLDRGLRAAPMQHKAPQPSYDVRTHAARTSAHSGGGATSSEGGDTETDYDSEDDHPEAETRYEWQHMLSNVLQGEVLKSEKTRISGSLTNDLDDSTNNRKWRAYQIWVRVRAVVRNRTVQQELDYLEEARNTIEGIWKEVGEFRVQDEPAEHEGVNETHFVPTPMEQVNMLITKIDWCDSLYPSIKSLRTEKAHVAEEHIMKRMDALISWQSITRRLRTQLTILQKWTGSDELEVHQPGQEGAGGPVSSQPHETMTSSSAPRLLDTEPFIERIFKEDTLQKTFEKSTIADLYRLIHDAKSVIINLSDIFQEMNLPPFLSDLIALINFPTNLVQEALKLRLNYVQHISSEQQPSAVLVDQLTGDFRSGLALAAKMKENFLEIMTPNIARGWPGGTLSDEYDKVLLDSLRFFFKLLNWKLKSGSKAIYLKETEVVENEWKFLSEAVEQIDGGDLLIGEHFCSLTHRLLTRVTSYFEEQLAVLEERDMTSTEMSRWFNQTLDNVRLRHRKLLRFGRAMQQRFENSAEYLLDDISLNAFVHALAETGHFLVYTGSLESQAIYVIATASIIDRQDILRQMLTRCFSTHTQAEMEAEFDSDDPHYMLILSPHEPFIWTGAILNLEDLPQPELDMREGRVRLVADGPLTRLSRAKQVLYDLFPVFKDNIVIEQKAHLGRINRELKKIKRSEFKLAEGILGSVERVHSVLRTKAGYEAPLANYFSFTADLGQRSMKHMEPALRARFAMFLMKFSIRWVGFICDDCVPSDSRTFKWAVAALEFAMLMTRNDGILRLHPDEFALLRAKVASCMTLLISHFDILGARSSFQAKQEKEKIDVAREEARKQLEQTVKYLNSVAHIRRHGDHQVDDGGDASLYFDDQKLLESLNAKRKRWLEETTAIDERRMDIESNMRMRGRVLDEQRPEDQSLLFLMTSKSNITVRWQQGKFIGGGTFGSVYLAVNLDSGGLMAVKEIKFQDLASAPNLIKTIKEESQVMEMLSHPNIVEYYGIEVHRDKVYIFEEYCQGGSLANLLEHGRIEDESVIQIYTVQLLDGLMYLHTMGVVHRDIKPDNILLDHMGVIKYVDFGAAKVLAKNQKTLAAKTRAPGPNGDVNSLTGTPMYMSPEVIKGDHRGRRGAMDVWSVGCVVLECATGRRPWSNLDNEWAIMFHIGIATKHPPLPEKGELSELGIDFIECCLDIDPLKRPSAAELMEHPWILEFSQQIANEMNLHNGGGGGSGGVETIIEEDEEAEGTEQEPNDAEQDGYYQHLEGNLGEPAAIISDAGSPIEDEHELVDRFKDVESVDGASAGSVNP